MKKLKTLKDLPVLKYEDIASNIYGISKEELKQNAIEHIKFFENVTLNQMIKRGWDDWGIVDYIEWANNLTEKNLKK